MIFFCFVKPLIFITIFNYIEICNGIPVEEELTLSYEENIALEKFSRLMEHRLPHDYMKQSIYLIKWLRHSNLDISHAEHALISHLKWRNENNMDTILEEDFTEINLQYPIYTDGEDYTGRPVLVADASEWDVRRGLLAGHKEVVLRHMRYKIESLCKTIRDKQSNGQNVTQMQVIIDLKGYNLVQHGCLNCLSVYITIFLEFRDQYPEMYDNLILVNAPAIFEAVADAVGLRGPNTNHIKIFGRHKEEWQEFLFSIISPNELPDFLGGTRISY